ncbi:MAG: ROK family protein [Myxococcota bacterium]
MTRNDAPVMGIDIGGSGVRGAIVTPDGEVGELTRVALQNREVETVLDAIREVVGDRRPRAIGIGMPGFVRAATVIASPNFPSWHEVDLQALVQTRCDTPAIVMNDANAATFGAYERLGDGRDLLLLTLGTGVGGGVVSQRRLITGRRGTAAEVGHIFAGGDALCGCGGRGCLETWCSTRGLARQAAECGHPVPDGQSVVEAADRGEAWAKQVLHATGEALGRGLASLTNVFAPEHIVLAGGLAQAERWLHEPAHTYWRAHAIGANVEGVTWRWWGRADDLAIRGSASAARAIG